MRIVVDGVNMVIKEGWVGMVVAWGIVKGGSYDIRQQSSSIQT